MADVLSQAEVEQLLAALDQGESVEAPAAAAATTAGAGPPGPADLLPADITYYDFKRPERVGKEHMRSLHAIHEGFSRNLGAALSGFLRTIVDVKLVSVDQLTYSEFIFSLENPTCFNELNCARRQKANEADPGFLVPMGKVVLEINPSITYPIIDRLLGGGSSEITIPRRPLTEIEARLARRLSQVALDGLTQAWANVLPLEFEINNIESNPQLVYVVPPNEVIVLVSLEIAIGDLRGMMNLCIPFNVIEPVLSSLSANPWGTYRRKELAPQKDVITNLNSAPIDVVVYLGETSITARDLLNLQVGDVLRIDKPLDSSLLIYLGGQAKFRGTPFMLNGRKVVRVDRRAEKNARING